jgi:hypothetical protein
MEESLLQHRFESIQYQLIAKLARLDSRLKYHNIVHTLDVVKNAERIAIDESIQEEKQVYLLKIAALYHDTGFLHTYQGHEEESCSIFLTDAEKFDLSIPEKKLICELIMVTKITHVPKTHLEMILRDADLDYLGRTDFPEISERLKAELLLFDIISSDMEWSKRQLGFLKKHHYFTRSSKLSREPLKQQHYLELL